MFRFSIAKDLLCVTILRKFRKDAISVPKKMKCERYQREVSEMAAGKSREAFSMLSAHLPISIQKHF